MAEFILETTTTNASLLAGVCAFEADDPTELSIHSADFDSQSGLPPPPPFVLFFSLPECIFRFHSLTTIRLENVIILGNATSPDPLVRITSINSFGILQLATVKLINPTRNYANFDYPYTPNWTALFQSQSAAEAISIRDAHLVGSVPSTIPQVLQLLDLGNNALTGTIPFTLQMGADGSTISLSNNALSGTVPSNMLSSAGDTFYLDLSFNRLTALPTSFNYSRTNVFLSLASNTISGSIPATLLEGTTSATTSLTVDLSGNILSGNIPPSLIASVASAPSAVTQLYLNLSRNVLTGSLPNFWSSFETGTPLTSVSYDFSYNILQGSLVAAPLVPPNTTAAYSTIRTIHWALGYNAISGSLPANLVGPLPNLFVFSADLTSNSLIGLLPAQLSGSFAQYASFSLKLASNQLYGSIPANWLAIGTPDRVVLDLSHNQLESSLPADFLAPIMELPTAASYVVVDLSYNSFVGDLPNVVRGATLVANINFNKNQFAGALNSSSLFTIVDPNAAGPTPRFVFSAAHNFLTGTLAVADRESTTNGEIYIDLSYNQLEALTVPDQVSYIYGLDVSGNPQLTGTLPAKWFGVSSQLEALNASHTQLGGSFPDYVSADLPLLVLDLSFTPIEFCQENRTAWTSSSLLLCNLDNTDAENCPSTYPALCISPAPEEVPTASPSSPASPSAPTTSGPGSTPRSSPKPPTSAATSLSTMVSIASIASLVIALALVV